VQVFQSMFGDGRSRTLSSDSDACSVVSSICLSSRCCCHGTSAAAATGVHCDSDLSSALSDAAAASRIAEMEAELAQLRQQLALIVMAQEQRASSATGCTQCRIH